MGLGDIFSEPTVGAAAMAGLTLATGGGYAAAGLVGLSAYSSLMAGEARASSLEEQMQLGLLASQETLARGKFNADLTISNGRKIQAEQKVAYAGMGVDVNTGSPLELAHQTAYNAYRESNRILDESKFAAGMQRRGALAYGEEASRERTSALLGTLASGGLSAYKFSSMSKDRKVTADSLLTD